jgi:hypothetical protein
MPKEQIHLPDVATRGYNISKTKKGWRIVNPNQTRTFKASQVAKFNSTDGEVYMVFRLLYPPKE